MTEAEKIAITKYDLYYEQRMTKVESVIENITKDVLNVKEDIKEIKNDIKDIRKDMKTDFRWLLAMMVALLGVMAHGFKWF